jgi:hypothetical protein
MPAWESFDVTSVEQPVPGIVGPGPFADYVS